MKVKNITIYAKSKPLYDLYNHTKDVLLSLNELSQKIKEYEGYREDVFNEKLWKSAFFSALLHDIGKIDYDFQIKVRPNLIKGENLQVLKPCCEWSSPGMRHNVVSYIYINAILSTQIIKDSDLRFFLSVAALTSLLHHYEPFYESVLNTKSDISRLLGDAIQDNLLIYYLNFLDENKAEIANNYLVLLNEILKRLSENPLIEAARKAVDLFKYLNNASFKNEAQQRTWYIVFPREEEDILKNQKEFLRRVLGLLMKVDHFSSASINVPSLKIDLGPLDVSEYIKRRLAALSGNTVWQIELLKSTKEGNVCLIAPTGSGKTEYAILRNGMRKMLYTLPLRVSLNDLYHNRFLDYLKNLNDQYDKYVGLLHSTNFIEFATLIEKEKGKGERGLNSTDSSEVAENYEDIFTKVILSSNLSPPFILSTPDQTLLISLKYFGSETIESMLPILHVVLDEVQAYNPAMFAIIGNTLEVLKKEGTKITVMTATLPAYMKKLLSEKLGFTIIDTTEDKYQSINVKNLGIVRHLIEYQEVEDEEEFINTVKNKVITAFDRGFNKILVVVNTVRLSLKIYEALKEEKNIGSAVLLFHARMLEKVKEEILEKFRNSNKIVLVATQTIEASVNIDADYIITQPAPPDSIIQRIGRVYRNRNSNYSSTKPNVSVIKLPLEKDPLVGENRSYDKELMINTLNVLKNYINKPLDFSLEKKFVEEATGDDEIKEKFMNKYRRAKDYAEALTTLPVRKRRVEEFFRNISSVTLYVSNFIEIKTPEDLFKPENKINLYRSSISLPYFVYEKVKRILDNKKDKEGPISWDENYNKYSRFKLFIKVDPKYLNLLQEEGLEAFIERAGLSPEETEDVDWNII